MASECRRRCPLSFWRRMPTQDESFQAPKRQATPWRILSAAYRGVATSLCSIPEKNKRRSPSLWWTSQRRTAGEANNQNGDEAFWYKCGSKLYMSSLPASPKKSNSAGKTHHSMPYSAWANPPAHMVMMRFNELCSCMQLPCMLKIKCNNYLQLFWQVRIFQTK